MDEKKSRILHIKRFMEEYADELHPVAVSDILANLKTEGIETSRHTVARELEQLTEAGVDVVCNHGKPNQYFIGERHFELPELKLLVDAVMASRFISPRKTAVLIKKLSAFTSTHQSLMGANATLLVYANKKIEELDAQRQMLNKQIADLTANSFSLEHMERIHHHLETWESVSFDDRRLALDDLVSSVRATDKLIEIEWKM